MIGDQEDMGVARSSAGRSAALRAEPVPVSGLRPPATNAARRPAILMVLDGDCPKCGGSLDTGYECNSCDFDGLLLVKCREAAELRGERMHPSGLYESEFSAASAIEARQGGNGEAGAVEDESAVREAETPKGSGNA